MTDTPAYHELTVACAPGMEDVVSVMLFEAGFGGILEERGPAGVVLTATADLSLSPDAASNFRRLLDDMLSRTGESAARIAGERTLAHEDWEHSWREGLTPVEIGRTLVVRPSWTPYDNTDGRVEIVIDPRMAFGTGHHATTALCLEALLGFDVEGRRVRDLGCGSGVLSIAAALLGAREVRGVDNDHWSIDNARDNALANGVADRVGFDLGDIATWKPGPGDLLFANLTSGVIIPNLPAIRALLAPGAAVVFSGVLASERAMFADAVAEAGFTVTGQGVRDEWISLTAARP